MKKVFLPAAFFLIIFSVSAQEDKSQTLQNLERNTAVQDQGLTAKLKYASRLFRYKDDLTSVIMIIPADSIVGVLAADTSFLKVTYEGNEGFIYAHQADIIKPEKVTKPAPLREQQAQAGLPMKRIEPKREGPDRYTYLANKYGPSMGTKLYEGKVWRGMTADQVQDAWGNPRKINRLISNSNDTKEEWVYSKYWLSFRNGVLTGWGPVK